MPKTKINQIRSIEILDSRGNPTIRTYVQLESGIKGRASVPSGASTGKHEALELRDKDPDRYLGKGVSKAVSNVNDIIAPEIIGMDAISQREIDERLIQIDGTPLKQNLGANAILSVSMAAAHAASLAMNIPLYAHLSEKKEQLLPVPLVNILNGGSHADNNGDIQEFMIVPTSSTCFSEAIQAAAETFHHLKTLLKEKGYSTSVGDEGGFAPNLKSNQEALDLIVESIIKAGYDPGKEIYLALDVAASEFFEDDAYVFKKSDGTKRSTEQMIEFYRSLVEQYPIISIEDGFAEDDWGGWQTMTAEFGNQIQIVGDDIFVTNLERLKRGIETQTGNSILIKLNQIGTLSETMDTVYHAQSNGYSTVISHRSGETEDTFIADLSVALNAGQIKTGSVCRSERVAKYNRILEIELELGEAGRYAGIQALTRHVS
jgi:enolase